MYGSIQVTLMEGCQLQNLMLQMAPSPHPQHAGTSFSSLLTAVDVAETLSPIRVLKFLVAQKIALFIV